MSQEAYWALGRTRETVKKAIGVGNAMVGRLVTALEDLGIGRVLLATRDAHEVYARLGFEPLANPTFWMERDRRPQRFVPGTASG